MIKEKDYLLIIYYLKKNYTIMIRNSNSAYKDRLINQINTLTFLLFCKKDVYYHLLAP